MREKIIRSIIMLSVCILLTGCHSRHEWQEADCAHPRTCIIGGETEGETLEHTWKWVSCTEPNVCSVCGASGGQITGHVWLDATCTEARTCQVCGETDGEPLGHKLIAAVEYESNVKCKVCGEWKSLLDPDIHTSYDAETGTVTIDEAMEKALKLTVAYQNIKKEYKNLMIWEKAFDWSVNEILTAYYNGTVTKEDFDRWNRGWYHDGIPNDINIFRCLSWLCLIERDEFYILSYLDEERNERIKEFLFDCMDEILGERNEEDLTDSEDAKYIPSPYGDWGRKWMDSVGEVRFPVFVVDFPDVKYKDNRTQEIMEKYLFTGKNSVASFYEKSSWGRLHMEGDIYFYTAQHDMEYYKKAGKDKIAGRKIFADEILKYFDSSVDFSQYDGNGDSVMDTFVITVPEGGDTEFWWSNSTTFSERAFRVDGLDIYNIIVCREKIPKKMVAYYTPNGIEENEFINAMKHELGHTLGLPDYYKYFERSSTSENSDTKMMHGEAGKELMQSSSLLKDLSDFSQFSKLQLGWLREDQVHIMPADAERADFLLPPASEGGCIVIFPEGKEVDFQGEYLLIEQNFSAWRRLGFPMVGGVRIFHVQANSSKYYNGLYWYRYCRDSSEYDRSNEGRAVLKLVNDGNGYYEEGATVTYENTGGADGNFGWYTKDGKKVTDPGFSIQIGEIQDDGSIAITIVRDGQ